MKVKVKPQEADGNVFNIIGLCRTALVKAFSAGSYDEVIKLVMTYCEVS